MIPFMFAFSKEEYELIAKRATEEAEEASA
jgi:hypothetical protein